MKTTILTVQHNRKHVCIGDVDDVDAYDDFCIISSRVNCNNDNDDDNDDNES
jgi:hypothetical protein